MADTIQVPSIAITTHTNSTVPMVSAAPKMVVGSIAAGPTGFCRVEKTWAAIPVLGCRARDDWHQSSTWLTMPSASLGSNQVDLGGMMPPASDTAIRSSMAVG